jgi:hypothetical protein
MAGKAGRKNLAKSNLDNSLQWKKFLTSELTEQISHFHGSLKKDFTST